ncbi:hypothetical protein D3C87_1018240 [compost metagenome]
MGALLGLFPIGTLSDLFAYCNTQYRVSKMIRFLHMYRPVSLIATVGLKQTRLIAKLRCPFERAKNEGSRVALGALVLLRLWG